MEPTHALDTPESVVWHRHVTVDGVKVFYRESSAPADAPTVLLLHGFPSASHQFRTLFAELGTRLRLIAPDYPGFGETEAPKDYEYRFDRLADTVEAFVDALDLPRFALYLFDFGGPVGMRIAERRPEQISALIVQNANAYRDGLSDQARAFISLTPDDPGARQTILDLLTIEGTRGQYLTGVADPATVAPEGWILDQHYLELPGRKEAMLALLFDYKTNLARYDAWQEWLRTHRPPTLITWGTGDPFFPEAGASGYLRDVPDAELHLFDAGHFALETHGRAIAGLIEDFLDGLPAQDVARRA